MYLADVREEFGQVIGTGSRCRDDQDRGRSWALARASKAAELLPVWEVLLHLLLKLGRTIKFRHSAACKAVHGSKSGACQNMCGLLADLSWQ